MKGPYSEDSGDTEMTRYEFSNLTIDLRRPKYGDIECQWELSRASVSRIHVNLMDLFDSDDNGNDLVNLPELMSDEYSLTKTETLPATLANASEEGEPSEDAESEVSEWYPYKYPFCRLPTGFGEPLSERARGFGYHLLPWGGSRRPSGLHMGSFLGLPCQEQLSCRNG